MKGRYTVQLERQVEERQRSIREQVWAEAQRCPQCGKMVHPEYADRHNRAYHQLDTIHDEPTIANSPRIVSNLTVNTAFNKFIETLSLLSNTPLLPPPTLAPVPAAITQPPLLVVESNDKQRRTAHAELIAHDLMTLIRGALDGNINAVSDAYDDIKAKVARYGAQSKCDALNTLITPDWLDPEVAAGVPLEAA